MEAIHGADRTINVAVLDFDGAATGLCRAVTDAMKRPCAEPVAFDDRRRFFAACGDTRPDVFFVDVSGLDSEEQLGRLASQCPHSVMIAVGKEGSLTRMLTVLEAGAHDFVTPPFDPQGLAGRIDMLLCRTVPAPAQRPADARSAAGSEPAEANGGIGNTQPEFEGFVGTSDRMRAIYDQIERIAPSHAPVFITGESGTGKELCARAVHNLSSRSAKPFIAINCAAIPAELMESEIFGHVRGAFTGANDARAGAAELADGGTLFLDEIGEMSLALQSKLLRFIQTGDVQRVGETRGRTVNVRIVCATNRDPHKEVSEGRFREDLFYRLHVLPVHLPPLRERRRDILTLATNFLRLACEEEKRTFARFEPAVEERLVAYPWPGNVRQLENAIRQIVVLNDGVTVRLGMLPGYLVTDGIPNEGLRAPSSRNSVERHFIHPGAPIEPLWAQERRIIEQALDAFDGNISQAAAALEISPSTIYRKKQSWSERLAS
ncbi:AAA family ATPase [Stappia sp. GBMRC 2046]|uniref:AAA family ATPase n=1 Tax=Stappia sediminis TaxID=2692190 RepID=A0A7X3LW07_9HYPH|nr:sigma-54 dependent transcriptional regulator [Stappia sediminis]MXN66161.1 AAA family ATPase [Stappia sediminis]